MTATSQTLSIFLHSTVRYVYISYYSVASSPGPSQILSRSCGKNWEKAWDQNYVMDWKWWTRLVQTESTLRTDRVHHFRSVA